MRSSVPWTLTSLCLAVGLHISQLPVWASIIFALLAGWSGLLEWRGARLPSRWLQSVVLIGIVAAVIINYRTLNGIDAGTTLLALMAGLKLLETREPRDHVVLLMICYFLVLASFLRGQYLWALPFYAASIWMTTASLLRATQSREALPPAACLRLSGKLLLQALPVMVVLFLLFPRVPGPFWAIPKDQSASTGLSDTMSPGDISELTLSSDPAFRVRFNGPVPPPSQRYWRGPVLHVFDGYRWSTPRGAYISSPVEYSGAIYDYSLMMEPLGARWVFALDLPETWQWQRRLRRTFDFQLLSPDPIDRPVTYQLRSRTNYSTSGKIGNLLTRLDTQFPADRNIRSQALARQLRAAAGSEAAFIEQVLKLFREQEFFYTLTPPRLDFNSVDDFLFNTRSGFCAHYASAFTLLMRAAGIPARVVTGYQGGEYNAVGGYYIVRQADAHAWSEVWLAERGWIRVDPTAVVSPERIERGSIAALDERAPITDRLWRATPWLANLRFAWDAVNTAWREKILEFNQRAQIDLLKRLGIDDPDWRWLAVLLAVGLAGAILFISLLLARELKARQPDPALQAYTRFCRRLARQGLTRAPHEGPLDFAQRVGRLRPDLAAAVEEITQLYLSLRYGGVSTSSSLQSAPSLSEASLSLQSLREKVAHFRPSAGTRTGTRTGIRIQA